jgi:hypothetical protein
LNRAHFRPFVRDMLLRGGIEAVRRAVASIAGMNNQL